VKKIEENQVYFTRLVGEQLSAVGFVMDYLQLQFDPYLLTVLTSLVVHAKGQSYRLGDLAYRDALCERIARRVDDVSLERDRLSIGFDDGAAFDISLKEEDYVGPEAVNFQFPEGEECSSLSCNSSLANLDRS
jgi:hypothetical protein